MRRRAYRCALSGRCRAARARVLTIGPKPAHGGSPMDSGSYSGTSATEEVRNKAQDTASTLVDQAQQVASTQVNSQMTRAASMLDSVAQSIHSSSSSMREQQPQIATVADQAAQRVEQVSDYLRQHDFQDVISEVEGYARREPLIFLGASFAIGFVAARFMKASSPSRSFSNGNGQSRNAYGNGQSGTGTTGYQGSNYAGSGYGTSDYGTSNYGGTSLGGSNYVGSDYGSNGGSIDTTQTWDATSGSETSGMSASTSGYNAGETLTTGGTDSDYGTQSTVDSTFQSDDQSA